MLVDEDWKNVLVSNMNSIFILVGSTYDYLQLNILFNWGLCWQNIYYITHKCVVLLVILTIKIHMQLFKTKVKLAYGLV